MTANKEFTTDGLFVRVPNPVITYSCAKNHLLLPLYVFSAIKSDPCNKDRVETTFNLIANTLYFNDSNASRNAAKIKAGLRLLAEDVPDCELDPDDYFEEKQPVLQGFGACLNVDDIPTNATGNTAIFYQFLNNDITMLNCFTPILKKEYYFFFSEIKNLATHNALPTTAKDINILELFDYYVYLKMKINMFATISKIKGYTCTMHENYDTIIANMHISRASIAKYNKQLVELGLIDITHKKLKNFLPINIYSLSDKWENLS